MSLRALLLLILILGWLTLTATLTGTISRLHGACFRFSFDLLDLLCIIFSTFFTAAFFDLLFFSTSRISILCTVLRFSWRAILMYVCSAFIWT